MASANTRKLPQTPDPPQNDDGTSRLEPVTDPPPPPPPKNSDSENAELRRVSTLSIYCVHVSCIVDSLCVKNSYNKKLFDWKYFTICSECAFNFFN